MKNITVVISLLVLSLLVYKHFNSANAIFEAVYPERVSTPVQTIAGTIKSCRGVKSRAPASGVKPTQDSYLMMIALTGGLYAFPLRLHGELEFSALKEVCDKQSLVTIEYTSMNKKLKRQNVRHVNRVVVQETGLVFNATLKIKE